ncbi:hypothetical protein GCM10017774_89470 [Lentzea cavernae]|uniref:Uncharacterized protein n=1 Tax=Lentzea cavernae TaxID=2020703 RepID=A0ABQ3MW18_9PSEU|nr:hypothetical protein GCM10017774_89470 [Lentzea cavernae]
MNVPTSSTATTYNASSTGSFKAAFMPAGARVGRACAFGRKNTTTRAATSPNTPASSTEPRQPSQSEVMPVIRRPDMPPRLLPAIIAPIAAPRFFLESSSAR